MQIKDRIKIYIKHIGISVREFEKRIGKSNGYVNNIVNTITADVIVSISKEFIDLDTTWLLTGEGKMIKEEKREEAIFIENPNIIMVPLVSQYAYAGYLCGYSDPEYMESLPKVPVMVDKEGKGNYMMFEVRGDSMEENSRDGIYEGDRLYCREIKKDLWRYKLHLKQWDFVIVHKTDGILVKRIIDHNISNGNITIHSLNPFYEDRILNLNDVAQLFNVVEVVRGRRR